VGRVPSGYGGVRAIAASFVPARPVLFGGLAVLAYAAVVIATTPSLPAESALHATLVTNPAIIVGIGVGTGLQAHLAEKRRRLAGCRVAQDPGSNAEGTGAKGQGGGTKEVAASSAAASFFSFFALVPLGCCGWWLYVLSLLPSVLGAGASGVLIENSQILAYAGLAVVFGLNGLTAYKVRRMSRATDLRNQTNA